MRSNRWMQTFFVYAPLVEDFSSAYVHSTDSNDEAVITRALSSVETHWKNKLMPSTERCTMSILAWHLCPSSARRWFAASRWETQFTCSDESIPDGERFFQESSSYCSKLRTISHGWASSYCIRHLQMFTRSHIFLLNFKYTHRRMERFHRSSKLSHFLHDCMHLIIIILPCYIV